MENQEGRDCQWSGAKANVTDRIGQLYNVKWLANYFCYTERCKSRKKGITSDDELTQLVFNRIVLFF